MSKCGWQERFFSFAALACPCAAHGGCSRASKVPSPADDPGGGGQMCSITDFCDRSEYVGERKVCTKTEALIAFWLPAFAALLQLFSSSTPCSFDPCRIPAWILRCPASEDMTGSSAHGTYNANNPPQYTDRETKPSKLRWGNFASPEYALGDGVHGVRQVLRQTCPHCHAPLLSLVRLQRAGPAPSAR